MIGHIFEALQREIGDLGELFTLEKPPVSRDERLQKDFEAIKAGQPIAHEILGVGFYHTYGIGRLEFGYPPVSTVAEVTAIFDQHRQIKEKIHERPMQSGKIGLYRVIDYKLLRDPPDMAESVSLQFIGYKGESPVSEWTFEEYKSFFAGWPIYDNNKEINEQ